MSDASSAAANVLQRTQQQMRDGNFDAAATALEDLLKGEPDHLDALYMLAVCERYRGRFEAAAVRLKQLKTLAPEHGRAQQEAGHLARAEGRMDAAIAAYARAVQLNPALEASYRGQIELLRTSGREDAAIRVQAQLDHLLNMPKPLVAVTDLIAQGRLGKAEQLCRRFLQQQPRNVDGMRLLADIGMRLGILEDAEFLLESAVAFAPNDVPARIDYIQTLRKRQRFDAALEQVEALLALDPENPQYRSLHAIVCMQRGDHERAIAGFDAVLERVPGDPVTLTAKGHALKTRGSTDAAVAAYRAAISSQPRHGEGYYALANLKTYRFDDAELEGMRAREDDPDLGHMDRVYLFFALGKAYEDRGEYAQAFHYYSLGNALKKAQSRYDADRMEAELHAQMEVCSSELFERHADVGHPAADPIFIVGLPRAGSTLLEQILASHSEVDGTAELPNVLSLAQRLRRQHGGGSGAASGAYPQILAELPAERFAEFGRAFIEDTQAHRQGAARFIDKMPNNFRHIGLIRLMLPNARIIDARRHPMACCFSGFKQLFAEGQEFSYDLTDIGRYYRDYVALMDHWDEVLPGHVLRVMHEDVVDDLEGQVRRILDFCELPFESACLRYWETERSVRTPSSEQVRRPIFRDSVEQWRHFEPWLGPLRTALGEELLARFPD